MLPSLLISNPYSFMLKARSGNLMKSFVYTRSVKEIKINNHKKFMSEVKVWFILLSCGSHEPGGVGNVMNGCPVTAELCSILFLSFPVRL